MESRERSLTTWESISRTIKKFGRKQLKHYKKSWEPKYRRNTISRYSLGIVIFYYEVLFKLYTLKTPWGMSLVYMLLYSLAWGLIGFLLYSILKPKQNRIIKTVLIFLNTIPFIVEFFIHFQFKVLYDLNTILNGAGGVVTGFMGHVMVMVFSLRGMSYLILLLLPGLLYAFLLKNMDPAKRVKTKRRIRTVIVIALLFFVTWILILLNGNVRRIYKKEYEFQGAVGNFGLMTGFRLELRNHFFGNKVTFETEGFEKSDYNPDENYTGTDEGATAGDANATAGDAKTAEKKDTKPKNYPYNALDLDFEKLAESASGTNKDLDTYLASLTPSKQNEYTGLFKGKNLIFITAEAFSGDIIDEKLTPTLYRLSHKGIQFNDYYVQATAGTTGGEFENIMGMLPMDGGKSMSDMIKNHNYMTMGSQLDRMGYYGKMYHNNDYMYYDRHKTHVCFGYSDGYMGYGNGMEEYVKKTWPESDLEMIQGTFKEYSNKEPFNIYYMSVSGHSLYGKDNNDMAKKNWDKVENLNCSDTIKAYKACNLELENALAWLVKELEKKGMADDTVIVVSADHFPYGLDYDASLGNMPYLSELYGYNVENYIQRDHNRAIIWSGALEKMDPIVVDAPASSIDLLPTLSNLFGTEFDSRLFPGRDVLSNAEPLMFNLCYDWKTDKGTYIAASGTFTPVDDSVEIPDDYVERMKTIVRNKVNFMSGFMKTDYYGHVFENYTFKEEKITRDRKSTNSDADKKDDTEKTEDTADGDD